MYDGEYLRIGYKQHCTFAYTYPELQLETEYKEMEAWLEANPHKRPRSRILRFVNAWLKKSARQRRTVRAEASVGRGPQTTNQPRYTGPTEKEVTAALALYKELLVTATGEKRQRLLRDISNAEQMLAASRTPPSD